LAETLQGRLRARLDEAPAARALACIDARGAAIWWTRAELHAEAARCAARMGELGLRAGDVVVLVCVDPREAALGALGAWRAGAIPLLVAPPTIQGLNSSLATILRHALARTEARLLVLTRAAAPRADELAAALPGLRIERGFETLLAPAQPAISVEPGLIEPRDAGTAAALQLSSGTTRLPRIARWSHARLLCALDGMAQGMNLASDDVYANWTPLYHDMGLVNNLLTCLVRGIPLALLSPLDVVRSPSLWLRALESTGATQTWSPNFGYALAAERCRDEELAGLDLSRVRGFWNAAERVHVSTFERFLARFARHGVRRDACRTNFGCVETIGGATFSARSAALATERLDLDVLREQRVARAADPTTRRAQTYVGCGRVHPLLELAVFDPAGRALPDGHVGTLGFRGRARFDGYLGDEEAAHNVLRDEWVLPGDEGYLRDGELYWTGRRDERINLQGKKLDPSELEPVLLAVEGLRKGCFCAFGAEDETRGTQVLVVASEVEPEAEADLAGLAARARAALSRELGLAVEELLLVRKGTLAKTSSGKRRHLHFRDLFARGELEALHVSRAGSLG